MPETSEPIMQQLPTYEKARLQTAAYKHVREIINRSLKPLSINMTQWTVLGVLKEEQATKTSEIAKLLEVEVPLITTLVQPLLASGFVDQYADERDRRSKPLRITDAGEAMMNKIDIQLRDDLKLLEEGINPEQLEQYFMTLQAVIANGVKREKR